MGDILVLVIILTLMSVLLLCPVKTKTGASLHFIQMLSWFTGSFNKTALPQKCPGVNRKSDFGSQTFEMGCRRCSLENPLLLIWLEFCCHVLYVGSPQVLITGRTAPPGLLLHSAGMWSSFQTLLVSFAPVGSLGSCDQLSTVRKLMVSLNVVDVGNNCNSN